MVDMQGYFITWKYGSFAVPGTDKTFVKEAENTTKTLTRKGFLIFGTHNWHPVDHMSFYTNHPWVKPFEVIKINGKDQVLWPPHAIQEVQNAKVLVDNNLFLAIVRKGENPKYDSYSGFIDDGGNKAEFESYFERNGIEKLIIYGLATDYCVKGPPLMPSIMDFPLNISGVR